MVKSEMFVFVSELGRPKLKDNIQSTCNINYQQQLFFLAMFEFETQRKKITVHQSLNFALWY